MNASKINCCLKYGSQLLTFGALVILLSAQLQAQDGPGVIDTPIPPVVDTTPDLTGGGGGGGGGATTSGADGAPVDFDDASSLDLGGSDEDNRNRGFVGATAPGISQNTFVGAASQTFGALAEGASFGGGVNDGTTIRVPSGGGGGGGGQGGGAGGFTGASSGSVIRSSIRTRLRPAFAAPIVTPQYTEFSFNDNLARQPSAQSLLGRYRVSIENRTATVTGVVNSQADADRLIRQLRLQPGVYGIVNELEVIK